MLNWRICWNYAIRYNSELTVKDFSQFQFKFQFQCKTLTCVLIMIYYTNMVWVTKEISCHQKSFFAIKKKKLFFLNLKILIAIKYRFSLVTNRHCIAYCKEQNQLTATYQLFEIVNHASNKNPSPNFLIFLIKKLYLHIS